MSRPSAVDISRLDPPEVIETISYEAIYAWLKTDFLARWAARRAVNPDLAKIDVLDLETDLIAVMYQTVAFYATMLRGRVNDGAKSVLPAFAWGATLDHLGSRLGVKRLVITPAADGAAAVTESDERFRRRILLAPEAFGTAGSERAYVYFALTAAPTIADATAIATGPGEVLVTLLGTAQPQPSAAELAAVRAVLARDDVRPLTDSVSVAGPIVRMTSIDATLTLYPGPSSTAVKTEARAQLDAWLISNRKLGRDLTRSAVNAQLFVEGVQSVAVGMPVADVKTTASEVVEVTSMVVRIGERDE